MPAGTQRTAVRAVFSWSCRHLDPDAARAFRLVACTRAPTLIPTRQPRSWAPASSTQARHWNSWPARTWCIHPDRAATACMTCCAATPASFPPRTAMPTNSQTALTRLFDHYLHTASVAMDSVFPAEQYRRPRIPAPTAPTPPVD